MGLWRLLKAFFLFVFGLQPYLCLSQTAPHYSFVDEAASAPPVSYHDYIIVGGGAAGCPLAATLSETANVLVLERGGYPYRKPGDTDKGNFLLTLLDPTPDSYAQAFITEDGVYNHRARVLGGGTVFNAGFYSHAEPDFIKEAGLDETLVQNSYQWVEKKLAFQPLVLEWQSAVINGLLEAGVLPYNGFTYDHINGTKIGATIFDTDDHRHSAADLLEYANPKQINVYLHATVHKIILTTESTRSRPRAEGVIFEDAFGVKHTAFLTKDPKSEIIISAGAIGSPQLLMLSGIGPASELEALGIEVVIDQPMVGQGLGDNTLNGLIIPSPIPVELSLISSVGISQPVNYIESGSGLNLAPSFGQITKFLLPFLNQVFTCYVMALHMFFTIQRCLTMVVALHVCTCAKTTIGSLFDTRLKGGIIVQKVVRPISRGHIKLRSTDPNQTPKARFNYFQEPEDLRKCVQGMKTIINIVNSKAFSKFRYRTISTQLLLTLVAALPLNLRPRSLATALSLEQFCRDTVMTFWHHYGGCQIGKVVDQDYRVLGVDGLRVIDASTFSFTPGTNPQATIMMLGRAMGVRIQKERHS